MQKKTILFVDDEADFVEMIKFQLEKEGYIVISANNGVEALAKLEQIKPDLIILDINMPKMSGLEFYNKISTQHGRTMYPVLVLTARANLDGLFKEIEAEGFMRKPFELTKLMTEIKRIITGRTNPLVFLIIPFDSPHAEEIKKAFLRERYDVSAAEDFERFKQKTEIQKPDFIILEYSQKSAREESVLEKITRDEIYRNIPIVVYSYLGFSADEDKCMDLGASVYLNCPGNYGEFIEAVKKIQLEKKEP